MWAYFSHISRICLINQNWVEDHNSDFLKGLKQIYFLPSPKNNCSEFIVIKIIHGAIKTKFYKTGSTIWFNFVEM